jgi:hypothetical protein
MLLRQMFVTSIQLVEPNLTIEVSNLINVYNELLEHADVICLGIHEDPLRELIEELGSSPI